MRRLIRSTMLMAMAAGLFVAVGCESSQLADGRTVGGTQVQGRPSSWSPQGIQAQASAQQAPQQAAGAESAAPAADGLVTSWTAYPTGHRASSALLVERSAPAQVNLNESFDYHVQVTNLTSGHLTDVVVYDTLPENFALAAAQPSQTSLDDRDITWELGQFEPGETRTIVVTGAATAPGTLRDCLTVTYKQQTCLEVQVVQPALSLAYTAPSEVLLCDEIPVEFVVTNTGTGTANNVVINQELSEGLTTADGLSQITADIGTLAAGESRTYAVTLKASQRGEYVNQALATGAGDLSANANATTIVRQPVLEVTRAGRERQYLGRNAVFTLTVTNTGDGVARNVVLQDMITGGQIAEASDQGLIDPEANTVTWELGDLSPGQSRQVTVTVPTIRAGSVEGTATAQASCADPVNAVAGTNIVGVPGILFELIDVSDPIELGDNVTYVITATNQGTAYMTNVAITALMEDPMEFVSAEGATPLASQQGNNITFEPLAQLAPREAAVWRITVKAVSVGDVRFTSLLTADQLGREVEAGESTNFYE